MRQCVSLAHLGSYSPGSTELGRCVNVRLRVDLMRESVSLASSCMSCMSPIRPPRVSAPLHFRLSPAYSFSLDSWAEVILGSKTPHISLMRIDIQVEYYRRVKNGNENTRLPRPRFTFMYTQARTPATWTRAKFTQSTDQSEAA